MAITAKQRKSVPKSLFGLPSQSKYPMDTKARTMAAKTYATIEWHQGKLSGTQHTAIVNKANGRLKNVYGVKGTLTNAAGHQASIIKRKGARKAGK